MGSLLAAILPTIIGGLQQTTQGIQQPWQRPLITPFPPNFNQQSSQQQQQPWQPPLITTFPANFNQQSSQQQQQSPYGGLPPIRHLAPQQNQPTSYLPQQPNPSIQVPQVGSQAQGPFGQQGGILGQFGDMFSNMSFNKPPGGGIHPYRGMMGR